MSCCKVGRGDGASYSHETVSQVAGNTELIKEKDMSRGSCDSGEGSWIIQSLCLHVTRAQVTASGGHSRAELGGVSPARNTCCCCSPGG